MIRRLDADRLDNILRAFYRPLPSQRGIGSFFTRMFGGGDGTGREDS
jgi:hypothetical protein